MAKSDPATAERRARFEALVRRAGTCRRGQGDEVSLGFIA